MLSGNKILIVEDDPEMTSLFSDVASELGYQIGVAQTLDKAKQESAEHLPDLVILDRMLADGSDGLGYLE